MLSTVTILLINHQHSSGCRGGCWMFRYTLPLSWVTWAVLFEVNFNMWLLYSPVNPLRHSCFDLVLIICWIHKFFYVFKVSCILLWLCFSFLKLSFLLYFLTLVVLVVILIFVLILAHSVISPPTHVISYCIGWYFSRWSVSNLMNIFDTKKFVCTDASTEKLSLESDHLTSMFVRSSVPPFLRISL